LLGKGSPEQEGLSALAEMMPEEKEGLSDAQKEQSPENMSAFQIFCTYVRKNKNAWYVFCVDECGYMVRFGIISRLPMYLRTEKNCSKDQLSLASLCGEWA
ncbi:MFS transporter, partial [Morganella morganii]|nr:MFS transporter [Morganella morganii]